jgi:chaperonin GroEL
MAYRILSRALEEPTRAILENAGCEAEPILNRLKQPGSGYEVRSGKIMAMSQAGINDSAHMLMTAVRQSIATAALALTVDVLVHHRKPESSTTP